MTNELLGSPREYKDLRNEVSWVFLFEKQIPLIAFLTNDQPDSPLLIAQTTLLRLLLIDRPLYSLIETLRKSITHIQNRTHHTI